MHVKGKRPQAETEIIPFYFLCIYIIFIYEKNEDAVFSLFLFFFCVQGNKVSPLGNGPRE